MVIRRLFDTKVSNLESVPTSEGTLTSEFYSPNQKIRTNFLIFSAPGELTCKGALRLPFQVHIFYTSSKLYICQVTSSTFHKIPFKFINFRKIFSNSIYPYHVGSYFQPKSNLAQQKKLAPIFSFNSVTHTKVGRYDFF